MFELPRQPVTRDPALSRDIAAALQELSALGAAAIDEVRRHLSSANVRAESKVDLSPVTNVDYAVHNLLRRELPKIHPCAVISEEGEPYQFENRIPETAWIVDPVDNTAALIRAAETSGPSREDALQSVRVFVALVRRGVPILGMVADVGSGRVLTSHHDAGVYRGVGEGIKRVACPGRSAEPERYSLYCSNPDRDNPGLAHIVREIAKGMPPIVRRSSLANGLHALLEGHAECLVEPRGIHVWDVAAFAALILAQGGEFLGFDGKPLNFAPPSLKLAPFFARRG